VIRSATVLGLALFASCVGLHIALWRTLRPRRHVLALFSVFFGPWLALTLGLCLLCPAGCRCPLCASWAAASLLHLALSCAYIQTYPAVQARSPTLRMLLIVRDSMPEGAAPADILARLDQRAMLADRIQDLVEGGLLREPAPGKLELGPCGLALILPFSALRRALGLGRGKG
jgi:hypothetical protein